VQELLAHCRIEHRAVVGDVLDNVRVYNPSASVMQIRACLSALGLIDELQDRVSRAANGWTPSGTG